jgi:hypothetical protein
VPDESLLLLVPVVSDEWLLPLVPVVPMGLAVSLDVPLLRPAAELLPVSLSLPNELPEVELLVLPLPVAPAPTLPAPAAPAPPAPCAKATPANARGAATTTALIHLRLRFILPPLSPLWRHRKLVHAECRRKEVATSITRRVSR